MTLKNIKSIFIYVLRSMFEGRTHFEELQVLPDRKLHVLANGPSLGKFLDNMGSDPFVDDFCDYVAVNDFIIDNRCLKIKPKYYVISDPMFLYKTMYTERGMKTMNALAEKVDWNITLFVRFNTKDSDFLPILEKNKKIKIEHYHSYQYPFFSNLRGVRRWLFKHGMGNGEYSTVVLNAIYVGITMGYKQIYLQGVDHTFFDGLMVNDDNIPCNVYKHSFDTSEIVKPMLWHYDDSRKYKDMPYFLKEMYRIFKGHWIMADYADYMGAKILNCTEGSLIDAYPRLKRK